MPMTVLGIGWAENMRQLYGVGAQGKVGVCKQRTRLTSRRFVGHVASWRIGLGACQGVHTWGEGRYACAWSAHHWHLCGPFPKMAAV